MERTTSLVTMVTPVSSYHRDQVARISKVVAAQTVPCQHIIIHDDDGRGAGYARNQGLAQVDTRFVVFLDADDDIAPDFAEKTLRAYIQHRRIIYTDWYIDGKRTEAPECAWVNSTWHVVTALIPTAWAKAVNGFDETLPAGEDTDFFMKLAAAGYCAKRLPEPLFTYGSNGQRSKRMLMAGLKDTFIAKIANRYGGKVSDCNTCGANPDGEMMPANEQLEGTSLVKVLWGGNRRERGRATGVMYPRTGNGATMYVYEADIDMSPEWFARVDDKPFDDVRDIAAWLMQTERAPDGVVYAVPTQYPGGNIPVKADVSKVLAKAKRR